MHDAGGVDWGPGSLKLTVPDGQPSESVAEIEEAGIALPAVPLAGALADRIGLDTERPSSTPTW